MHRIVSIHTPDMSPWGHARREEQTCLRPILHTLQAYLRQHRGWRDPRGLIAYTWVGGTRSGIPFCIIGQYTCIALMCAGLAGPSRPYSIQEAPGGLALYCTQCALACTHAR